MGTVDGAPLITPQTLMLLWNSEMLYAEHWRLLIPRGVAPRAACLGPGVAWRCRRRATFPRPDGPAERNWVAALSLLQ